MWRRTYPGCYSESIQRVEKVKDEYEGFLKCEVFDDAEEGFSASVVRVEEEEEGNKKGNDGGGLLQFFCKSQDYFTKCMHITNCLPIYNGFI